MKPESVTALRESPILEMKNITKRFPGVVALADVNFKVDKGSVHCLIGANGAGKSTLMKILSGLYQPDQGEIWLEGEKVSFSSPRKGLQHGVKVIYQELSLVEDLTVAENIFAGNYPLNSLGLVDWKAMNTKAQEMVDSLGIHFSVLNKVSDLSMGHKQITELCKALLGKVKILIMDEPSAALSKDELQSLIKVIADLKSKGITVIYISHRLEELYMVGDAVTVLRDGKHVFSGPIRDLPMDDLVGHMIGRKVRPLQQDRVPVVHNQPRDVVLRVESLNNDKLHNISLTLGSGEVLGLYGLVGSGRTETLRAIFGVDEVSGGMWLYGKKCSFTSPCEAIDAGIGLIPEQRKTQGLVLSLPVWENALMAAWDKVVHCFSFISYGRVKQLAQDHVRALQVKTPCIHTEVGTLSGGNQQKVVIAKWLLKNSNILLFDEPTQGIDVGAKEEIYQIIRGFAQQKSILQGISGTGEMAEAPLRSALVASSELEELTALCDRILVFYEGGIIGEFLPPFGVDGILHAAITGEYNAR